VMPSFTPSTAFYIGNVSAIETNGGDTKASASEKVTFYEPPPGWKITHISEFENSEIDFISSKAEGVPIRTTQYPGAGIVESIVVEGDFPGEDIGKTNAHLTFKLLQISIQQVSGCK
ncbi:MAG: hypothetical protein ABI923_13985, partial [bacterium]